MITKNPGLKDFLTYCISPNSSTSFSAIFSQSESTVSSRWITACSGPLPCHLAPSQPHLSPGHVLKAEHRCTDSTGWEESTKPELIKVGKLQRPCLTLIDLYQNSGIHVGQMLAHCTESSVGEEVNKYSLIRLHQRPSYHPGNLVMLNNATPPPPLGILSCRWVYWSITGINKLQVTFQITSHFYKSQLQVTSLGTNNQK